MDKKQQLSVLQACTTLQSDLFNKTDLLTNFILNTYGENTYSIVSINTKRLECSEIILQDDILGDTINIILVETTKIALS